MGNQPSSSASSSKRRSSSRPETTAERVKKVVGEVQEEIKRSVKKLDDDHPAAQLIDTVCGTSFFDDDASRGYRSGGRSSSFYSEDNYSEDGSRTVSEDDTYDDRSRRSRADKSVESQSYISQSDYDSDQRNKSRGGRKVSNSFDTEDESRVDPTTGGSAALQKQPLASSFAKRCYFTKAGIGRTTQHYEGLTLTGNVVLMLAAAMKLKGCPTICDEDLRRVEQTYPNQFSRLPDELLLSSGWRRISKYCHFSNKPIPDGVPFFHSKQRLHPSGGYYFLLAAAVGMTRPLDVEPLSRDTLVLLETDFPSQCDAVPSILIKDPEQWTLVDKFCFFSGGPINTEEDVYYQADFDGNAIYMLAFLSPSLTPHELYKLGEPGEPTLNTISAVQEVESVYDLTSRDFDDLKLYHLGPCRALPQFILQPQAWTKILPPHFLAARQQAMIRAEDYMQRRGIPFISQPHSVDALRAPPPDQHFERGQDPAMHGTVKEIQREIDEEGAFHDPNAPMDESDNNNHMYQTSPQGWRLEPGEENDEEFEDPDAKQDPPDDEPPSLQKEYMDVGEVPDPEDDGFIPSPQAADPSIRDFHRSPGGTPSVHASTFLGQDHTLSPTLRQNYPTSPIDEQQSAMLISLGSPVEPPTAENYDPFESLGASDAKYEQGFQMSTSQPEPRQIQQPDPQPSEQPRQRPQLQPLDTSDMMTNQQQMGTPRGHYPMTPPNEDVAMYGGEEKKISNDETEYEEDDEQQQQQQQQQQRHYNPAIMYQFSQDSALKSGEEDFIPIIRDGYRLSTPSAEEAISPQSVTSDASHTSAALRGAQEILRKNRRRRAEMAMKKRPPESLEVDTNDLSPTDQQATEETWESESDVLGSNVSGSSIWSNDSGTTGDRTSRRALILQMAKARMRNNKESPTKGSSSVAGSMGPRVNASTIDEEGSIGGHTETHTDIDFAGDLD